MIIPAKGSSFTPHPASDTPIEAVLVDYTAPEKKLNATSGKMEDKFSLIFETTHINTEGKYEGQNAIIYDNNYTVSFHEKSNLRKTVIKMLGKDPGEADFDIDTILGLPVKIIIEHNESGGRTYANISWYGPNKNPNPFTGSTGEHKYVRIKDRPAEEPSAGTSYNKAEGQKEAKEPWQNIKIHASTGSKFAGQSLDSLPTEAIEALHTHWLPAALAAPKPSADDKRLMEAIPQAIAVIRGMQAPPAEKALF